MATPSRAHARSCCGQPPCVPSIAGKTVDRVPPRALLPPQRPRAGHISGNWPWTYCRATSRRSRLPPPASMTRSARRFTPVWSPEPDGKSLRLWVRQTSGAWSTGLMSVECLLRCGSTCSGWLSRIQPSIKPSRSMAPERRSCTRALLTRSPRTGCIRASTTPSENSKRLSHNDDVLDH
jgi:hypothetical protein